MAKKRTRGAVCCGPEQEARHPNPADDRKAVGVDPDIKAANLARLKRIEGQVRGIQKMIEEDRYCADILGQVSAIHEALRGVSRELLRNHLHHCVAFASRQGGDDADEVYDELVELMYKSAR